MSVTCITWLGVHRFEPRYDRGAMDTRSLSGMDIKGYDATMAALDGARSKTYIHDICIRCGTIVKREQP